MKNLIKNAIHFLLGIKTKDSYHGGTYSGDASACPIVGKGHDPKSYGYEEIVDESTGWRTLRPIPQQGDVGYKCKEVCDGTCAHHAILKKKEN
jgi:hypothetical protein